MRTTVIFLFISLLSFSGAAQILYGASTDSLGDDCYQLTNQATFVVGYAYEQTPLDLTESFDLTFDVYLGDNDGGADGMVFVLRGDLTGSLFGATGGSLGFSGTGFSSNALGIEIDTWQNTGANDPFSDHLGIVTNGDNNHNSTNALTPAVAAVAGGANIEDGQEHTFRVRWDATEDSMTVYFDCDLRLTYVGDLVNDVFGGDDEVHWGFLGTTGGAVNVHRFCGPRSVQSVTNPLTAFLLCPGDSVQLNAGDTQVDYLWSPTNGLSDSLSNAPWASPQDSTTYVVRKILGCDTIFDSVDVNIFPFVLDLLEDTGICEMPFTIEGPVGAEFYLWNTGASTPNITVDTSGLYSLIASSGECTDTDYVFLQMSYPTVGWNDTVLCEGEVLLGTYNDQGSTLWSTGDTIDSIIVDTEGEYWVELSNDYCSRRDTVDIRYRPVQVSLDNDSVFCSPSQVSAIQHGADSIFWSTGDTSIVIAIDSSAEIWIIGANQWCSDTDTAFFEVQGFALVDSFFLFCDQTDYTVDAEGPTGSEYAWSSGDSMASVTFSESGTYTITVSTEYCSFQDSIAFVFSQTPFFDLGPDKVICVGQDVLLTPSEEWSSIRWSNGDTSQTITVSDTGLFFAETAFNGCFYRDSIFVEQRSLDPGAFFIAPNVFTPNGDGVNDLFRLEVEDPSLLRDYNCSVYSRWGVLVHEATFTNAGWDGTMPSGEKAAAGTYFYQLRANTVCTDLPSIEVKDNLTLMR